MAIKTFTTGEVLTAADTNTYLANSGLVYVASGTLSSTSTDFTGCFTSTYDNYRIILSSVSVSSAADIYFRLLTGSTPETAANYSWGYRGLTETGTSGDSNFAGSSQGFTGITISIASTIVGSASLDFYSPKLGQRTLATAISSSYTTGFVSRSGFTHNNLSNQFDGIQFRTGSASTMAGTVNIYGYRKP